MFQSPFQKPLDAYARNKLDESTMLALTAWKKRWGYPYSLYRPIIQLAKDRQVKLLALNADGALVKSVAKQGIENLSPAQSSQLPQLDLQDSQHRAWFDAQMAQLGAHGHQAHAQPKSTPAIDPKVFAQRMYTAQVVWDETMAQHAADWLKQGDARQIIILAGTGHCHDSAIIRRLKRRGIEHSISVLPVIDDGNGNVAKLLESPIHDYLFVLGVPKPAQD